MGKSEKQNENSGNSSGNGTKRGSATPARRVTIVLVLISFLGMYFLSGCLVSLGAPLVRKVEPNRWIFEAGGGPAVSASDTPGWGAYAYVGRGLGEHFEIGILPYGYAFVDYGHLGALFVPVKWDPFVYEWPFHLIFFTGPVLYTYYFDTFDESGLAWALGTGFFLVKRTAWPGDKVELYSSTSVLAYEGEFVDPFSLPTMELGLRVHITDRFTLGVNILGNFPLGAGLGVTVGTVL